MVVQTSPRSLIKGWLKGEVPDPPLLMPVVFGLGARLEHVPPLEFAGNPTKIANALRQIRGTLKVDGVCCYWDPVVEAEALRNSGGPEHEICSAGPMDRILGAGRVGVALEVVKRARVMLRDDPALLVRVTGPLTLAGQLSSSRETPSDEAELVEFCAEVTAALAKAYVGEGADVVLLVEDRWPRSVGQGQHWGALLEPVINLVKFYEALPVLVLAGGQPSPDALALIADRDWECVLCPSLSAFTLLPQGKWTSISRGLALALPVTVFDEPGSSDGIPNLQRLLSEVRPLLLTTAQDIPATADMKQVALVFQQLRRSLHAR